MDDSPLLERMRAAVGNRTHRHLSELTSASTESVRRYLEGRTPPSMDFLSELCRTLGVSGEWLLTGRGPMRSAEASARALSRAGVPELLAALANSVESLIERVERLETFLSTMETRVRGRGAAPPGAGEVHEATFVAGRAGFIARAVPERSCADDRPDAAARGA
ncbi:MAG: helix-turn-helix transcriptional regulator [Phycisphaerales bacterium]|nr:helix-turn-helix transcriptional regulator [Phycisphaerales bacterium]